MELEGLSAIEWLVQYVVGIVIAWLGLQTAAPITCTFSFQFTLGRIGRARKLSGLIFAVDDTSWNRNRE